MTITYWNVDDSGLGTRLSLASQDSAIIGRLGALVSTNGIAIDGQGGNSVLVQGLVGGVGNAMVLGLAADQGAMNRLSVAASGTIWAEQVGATLYGQDARITNHGVISADAVAIAQYAAGGGLSHFHNDGTIDGGNVGISRVGTESMILTNLGTIRGLSAAIEQGDDVGVDGALSIVNRGNIFGDIYGAGGRDVYVSRGDGLLVGTFFGGAGSDTFRSGLAAEAFNGGTGVDTADYSAMTAISVVLDNLTEGEGGAFGDVLGGVEIVMGSRRGADRIEGMSERNDLSGQGGRDQLLGGGGADTLQGGLGRDILTGGADDDVFMFWSPGEGGDQFQDFSHGAAGSGDHISINAIGFGGGLSAGALGSGQFTTRSDNHAQDSNDRFIFRTTDLSLWYDADGSGAGKAVILAFLQHGATLTYQDFIIF